MTSLLGNIRGTVQGALGATNHVLWWLSWRTGGENAVRERRTG